MELRSDKDVVSASVCWFIYEQDRSNCMNFLKRQTAGHLYPEQLIGATVMLTMHGNYPSVKLQNIIDMNDFFRTKYDDTISQY